MCFMVPIYIGCWFRVSMRILLAAMRSRRLSKVVKRKEPFK
jgi:hypothetical protein